MKQQTIGKLIAFHAEQSPDAVAIEAPHQGPLCYGRLHRQMQLVSEQLHDLGFVNQDRLAVIASNGPNMAVAFLSIAAAFTCAPLNPAYREQELDFYLSDLGARAIILGPEGNAPAEAVARKRGMAVLRLVPRQEDIAGLFDVMETDKGDQLARSPVQPGSTDADYVALVLHTSGTTSRPKLVPLSQMNVCCSADHVRGTLGLTATDRCLNVMPLFHIHGLIGALLSSLAAGGSVVCTPGFDPSAFFDWLDRFQPTWYTAVPTIHQAVLSGMVEFSDNVGQHALRLIRSSSSSLPRTVMEELERRFRVPMIESYGMTEAAHQICSNPLPPLRRKPGSVGVAAGPNVAVMDEAGNLLPANTTGEIVISGINVTRGYERNPDANVESFVNGWFRTGDRGRIDVDGYVFLDGRIKEIINRGGEKVSPREVDEVILEHPEVAEAVTFAVSHPRLGEDVAVAVVLKRGARVTEAGVRAFAFERLADFKVPSQVVFLDRLPVGATGKLQRIGLADKLAAFLQREYEPPATLTEEFLADAWKDVLGRDKVGIHDNFFALGGDSLLAGRIAARLRSDLNIEVPLAMLFKLPTIEELAAEVEGRLIDEVAAMSEDDVRRLQG